MSNITLKQLNSNENEQHSDQSAYADDTALSVEVVNTMFSAHILNHTENDEAKSQAVQHVTKWIHENPDKGVVRIDLLPGAHPRRCANSERWTGVVETLDPTKALVKDIWRDDMFACQSLDVLSLPQSSTAAGLRAVLCDALPFNIELPMSCDENDVEPLLDSSTLTSMAHLLKICANKAQFVKLIEKLQLDDFSFDERRLQHQQQNYTADDHTSENNVDTSLQELLDDYYKHNDSSKKLIPFGACGCSINFYQTADSNYPNRPQLWLMIRNYDPIANAMIFRQYADRPISKLFADKVVPWIEERSRQSCRAIAERMSQLINAIFEKPLDQSFDGLTLNVSDWYQSSRQPVDGTRHKSTHFYNTLVETAQANDGGFLVHYYSGCLHQTLISDDVGNMLPLGLGLCNGLIGFLANHVSTTDIKTPLDAFPLGVEMKQPLGQVTKIDDLSAIQKQSKTHLAARCVWKNSSYKFHPKLIELPDVNNNVEYVRRRMDAIMTLLPHSYGYSYRLWPIQSYISSPVSSYLTEYELLVCHDDGKDVHTSSPTVSTTLMTSAMRLRIPAHVADGFAKLSYEDLKKILLSDYRKN